MEAFKKPSSLKKKNAKLCKQMSNENIKIEFLLIIQTLC